MTRPHAYYNDNDPYVCAWLSNLMDAGHITPGKIDDRSIEQIDPAALKGYERVHLFAGIGGWELALNLAGWQGPVWTGSCPCQPLSSAGQRKGHADERHLWPAFHRLVAVCRPATVFGEQVASKDGREWLSAVRADLEWMGYAFGAADMPAAGVGAPHIRQRLWWVADADGPGGQQKRSETWGGESASHWCSEGGALADTSVEGRQQVARGTSGDERANGREPQGDHQPSGDGEDRGLGWAEGERCREAGRHSDRPEKRPARPSGRMGDPQSNGRRQERADTRGSRKGSQAQGAAQRPWDDCRLIPCSDGKARPTQPGLFPLAHGIPNRMGRLRAYGNAIVPQVAAEFVSAYMEASHA